MDPNSLDMSIPPDKMRYKNISLDDIDLNLLLNTDTTVPLYSVQGPEYCEFEVYAQEIPTPPDAEKLENSNCRHCHICEVDFPVSYYDCHKMSSKHQVYAAISQISLERLKKQMETDLPIDSRTPAASTYYCEHCSCAVNCTNKDTHEASTEHLTYKKRDEIVNNLMLIYQNPSNFEGMYKKLQKTVILNKTEKKLNWWDEVFLFPKKVNTMTEHKINYVDDYTVEIIAKSGAKVSVPFDNFHGYCDDENSGTTTLCRVCRLLTEDKYSHMNDERHVKMVTAAIKDKHCIRNLDPIFNNCILCNEIIENSEVHIVTKKHQAALEGCVIDDTAEIKKILASNLMSVSAFNNKVYFCNPCQLFVEQNRLTQHIDKEYHAESLTKANKTNWYTQFKKRLSANEYCNRCKVAVSGGKKGMKDHKKTEDHKILTALNKKRHHHLLKCKYQKGIVTCKLCVINICSDKGVMDEHIASNKHQAEYTSLLQENKMEILDQRYVLCNLCKVRVPFFDDLTHMKKKGHRKNIESYFESFSNDKDGFSNTDIKIDSHCEKENKNQLKEKEYGYDCNICCIRLDKNNFDAHIKSEWHLRNLTSKAKHNETQCIGGQSNIVGENLQNSFTANEVYYCQSCCVTIQTNLVEIHTNSDMHRIMYNLSKRQTGSDSEIVELKHDSNYIKKLGNSDVADSYPRDDSIANINSRDGGSTISNSSSNNLNTKDDSNHFATAEDFSSDISNLTASDSVNSYRRHDGSDTTSFGNPNTDVSRLRAEGIDISYAKCYGSVVYNTRKDFGEITINDETQKLTSCQMSNITYEDNLEEKDDHDHKSCRENVARNINKLENSKPCFETGPATTDSLLLMPKPQQSQSNDSTKQNTQAETQDITHIFKDKQNDYCSVCSIKVDPANVVGHVAGRRHKKNMTIAEKAKSNSNTNNASEVILNGFCSVCKVKVPNGSADIALHVKGAQHQANVDIARKNSTKTALFEHTVNQAKSNPNLNTYLELSNCVVNDFCSICKVIVTGGSFNIAQHVKGAQHKSNLVITRKESTKTALLKHQVLYATQQSLSNDSTQQNTQLKIPDSTQSNTKDHPVMPVTQQSQSNYQITKQNTLPQTQDSTQFKYITNGQCSICSTQVAPANVAEHVAGWRHRENMTVAEKAESNTNISTDLELSNSVVNGFCSVCKVKVPSGFANIALHVKGASHNRNMNIAHKDSMKSTVSIHPVIRKVQQSQSSDSTKQNAQPKTQDNTNILKPIRNDHCFVCSTKVAPANVAEHLAGRRHRENLTTAKKSKPNTNTNTALELMINGVNTTNRDLFNVIPQSNEKLCTVCNVKVTNSIGKLNQHVKSDIHIENSKISAMFDITPNSERLCKICKVRVSNTAENLRQHVNGGDHIGKVKISEMFDMASYERICKICRIGLPNSIEKMRQHLQGQSHLDFVKRSAVKAISPPGGYSILLSKSSITASPISNVQTATKDTVVYCDICDIIMDNARDIELHQSSVRHKNSFVSVTAEKKHSETSPAFCSSSTVMKPSCSNSISISTSTDTMRTNSRDSSIDQQHVQDDTSKVTAEIFHCQICNVDVSYKLADFEEHKKGRKHKFNVNKLNSTIEIKNKAPKDQNLINDVKPANVSLSSELYDTSESNTKNTKSNLPELYNENIDKPSTSNANFFSNFNVNTPQTESACDKRKPETDRKVAIESDDDDDGFYICEICKVLVDNNQTAIQSHLNSYKHHTKLQENKEKLKAESQEVKLYFCEICKIKITDNPIKIKAHNESAHHKLEFEKLFSRNKITVRNDNKVCHCESCDVVFNKLSVLTHIAKDRHKQLVANEENKN